MKQLPIDDDNLNYIERELSPWLRTSAAAGIGGQLTGANGRSTAADWLIKLVAEVRCLRKKIKLMVAAPDLLEALKKVVAISDRKHDAWEEARAAIAKATSLKPGQRTVTSIGVQSPTRGDL